MRKFIVRIYILGECVMGDNDTIADCPAVARGKLERDFWAPVPVEVEREAPGLAKRIKANQELARVYGLTITAKPSRAA